MRLGTLAWREFAGAARRPSTWWIRYVYLAAVGLFVLMIAWGDSIDPFPASRRFRAAFRGKVPRVQERAFRRNRRVFLYFSAAQAAALGLLALVLVHAELSKERTARTLDLLLVTGSQPLEIVLGKIAGVWGRLLVLFLCGLAVMLALLSRGGISGEDILVVSALTGAVVALSSGFAAVGGSLACLPLTLLLAFGYYLLPVFSVGRWLYRARIGNWVSWISDFWLPTHFLTLANPASPPQFRGYSQGSNWILPMYGRPFAAAGITVAGSLLLFLLAAGMLSRPGLGLGGWAAALVRRYDAFMRRLNAVFARRIEFDPSARLLWTRPFLWREFRRSLFSRFDNRLRVSAAATVAWLLAALSYIGGGGFLRQTSSLLIQGLLVGCGLVCGLAAANSLAGDLVRARLDVLLAAPRGGFMRAKAVYSMGLILPLSLAALAAVAIVGFAYDFGWTEILLVAGLTFSACGFAAGVGFASAAWLRSAGWASVAVVAALGAWAFVALFRIDMSLSSTEYRIAIIAASMVVWLLGSLAAGWLVSRSNR